MKETGARFIQITAFFLTETQEWLEESESEEDDDVDEAKGAEGEEESEEDEEEGEGFFFLNLLDMWKR